MGEVARVIAITRPMRMKYLMRRVLRIYEDGTFSWSVRFAGKAVTLKEAGIDNLDLEHLLHTGTIISEAAVRSSILRGAPAACRYVIGGLSVEGKPAKYTVEVTGARAIVTDFEWQ